MSPTQAPVRYVFDYDGTVTNNGHRRHLRGSEYHERRGDDGVNLDVLQNVAVAHDLPSYQSHIDIVTGRHPDLAEETLLSFQRALAEFRNTNASLRYFAFRGRFSFRLPNSGDAPPSRHEKLVRTLNAANSFGVSNSEGGGLNLQPPARVLIFEDDKSTVDELVSLCQSGAFVAKDVSIIHVPYANDGSRLPLVRAGL